MTIKFLKDQAYYEDLYDQHTVEDCRRWIQIVNEKGLPKGAEKLSKEEQRKLANAVIELPLWFRTGERYMKREETIRKWMDDDLARDEFIRNHPAPIAYCPKCNRKMNLIINELDLRLDDPLRMLYIYRCDPCEEKKGFYSDNEPYVFERDFCPKCKAKWNRKSKRVKNIITITNTCPECKYKKVETEDLDEPIYKEPELDPEFEKDKKQFCLSKEEGEKYCQWITVDYPDLKRIVDEHQDQEKHKEIYEEAKNIKRLTIAELSDLLAKGLEKAYYKGLVITNTEVTRDLIISFTIQDTKQGRNEGYSSNDLKKALIKLLDGTNWKLMSDGLSYKLGLLSGRLRGIDEQKVIYEELKEEKGISKHQIDL